MTRFAICLLAAAWPLSAGERRAAHRIVPAHLQPVDLAPAAPPVLAAISGQAGLAFVDRPQPLQEGVRRMLEAAPTVDAAAAQDPIFGGAAPWGSSLALADLNGGQKLEGVWVSKSGGDPWSFTFVFGDFGLLQCFAQKGGDTWAVKDLGADFDAAGKYRGVSSGAIFNSQGKDKASFSFQLDEQTSPWTLRAQVRSESDGRVQKVTAQRPPQQTLGLWPSLYDT
mmetsp:Transcript_96778/g.269345  ORF Transcript_96778/g.269345 Transcript_96778/m.269345 type:complete len:225 (+) Transcript_96778:83-757(+)